MIPTLADIWPKLSKEGLWGEALCVRRAAPEFSDNIFAAIDASGKRHLLIELDSSEITHRDTQSRGVKIETRGLSVLGGPSKNYLVISCNETSGHEAFDLIGCEIARQLKDQKLTPIEISTGVISKWRRFWGKIPKQLLSHNAQLGLFGELLFFSKWLCPNLGVKTALQLWKGPAGARHDFEAKHFSVEVKSTTSTRGRIHHVNGLEQLLPPVNGTLYFFSLHLREEGGGDHNLVKMVNSCRFLLDSDSDDLWKFEEMLLQSGYASAHEQDYSNSNFRIISENLYEVREGFPRFIPEHITKGSLSGIEGIEYDINLSGAHHLIIANNPLDMPRFNEQI